MNIDEITLMARKAGFVGFDGKNKTLCKFAALVAEHEREECAKVCESYLSESPYSWGGTTMAEAIRARGQA
jgi:hypothetical protein